MRATFKLNPSFVESYRSKPSPFGLNGFGELVYRRTYSRLKEDGTNEDWTDTVARVVTGVYRMQESHIRGLKKRWDSSKAQRSAQTMFDLIWNMKFLPPGRGLWAMGSEITEERGLYAALNNCAMVSTDDLSFSLEKPFCFLMDMSMLGVGVGFDTKGKGSITILNPDATFGKSPSVDILLEKFDDIREHIYPGSSSHVRTSDSSKLYRECYTVDYNEDDGFFYQIPDTREGWVMALAFTLSSYFRDMPRVKFLYDHIRPAGLPIKGFGGVSSGPLPLKMMLDSVSAYLDKRIGEKITVEDIVTIQNMIGVCVVAGNVRRTAEIAFGEADDEEFMDLKNYRWNPVTMQVEGPAAHRAGFGWTSNNSIFAKVGMDYTKAAERTAVNGEPGYAWLENMQNYSRMIDPPDYKDYRVKGGNPCLEQSLESYELCNLVETYPARHETMEEWHKTLKYAYLYAKTVTLGMTHWEDTNEVMSRNRRIGTSISGFAQARVKFGIHKLRTGLDEGFKTIQKYDRIYSEWLSVPRSIKTTSVKPSGTVSLLAGATPGMHFPHSRFCIRRMRLSIHSNLIQPLKDAGYEIEPCVGQEDSTVVVSVPIDMGEGLRGTEQVSMWEQFEIAAFLQAYWTDNQVSCTVTFDPRTEGHQIKYALELYESRLKGISLLPRLDAGAYPQMPYEEISEAEYLARLSELRTPDFSKSVEQAEMNDKFCDSEKCELPAK